MTSSKETRRERIITKLKSMFVQKCRSNDIKEKQVSDKRKKQFFINSGYKRATLGDAFNYT